MILNERRDPSVSNKQPDFFMLNLFILSKNGTGIQYICKGFFFIVTNAVKLWPKNLDLVQGSGFCYCNFQKKLQSVFYMLIILQISQNNIGKL